VWVSVGTQESGVRRGRGSHLKRVCEVVAAPTQAIMRQVTYQGSNAIYGKKYGKFIISQIGIEITFVRQGEFFLVHFQLSTHATVHKFR